MSLGVGGVGLGGTSLFSNGSSIERLEAAAQEKAATDYRLQRLEDQARDTTESLDAMRENQWAICQKLDVSCRRP